MSEAEDRPPIRATQEMRDIIDDPIRFAWVTRDYYEAGREKDVFRVRQNGFTKSRFVLEKGGE